MYIVCMSQQKFRQDVRMKFVCHKITLFWQAWNATANYFGQQYWV